MSVDEKAVLELLEAFREELYPAHTIENILHSGRSVEFSLSRAERAEEFLCEAAVLRAPKPFILLSQCYRQGSGYPPDVRAHVVEIDGRRARDVCEQVFPIEDIVDQLDYFVVDEPSMRRYLENATLRKRVLGALTFYLTGFHEDDLSVSLKDIPGVIEGAAYAGLRWNGMARRFERVPA